MPLIKVNSEPPKPTTLEDLGYVQVVRCKDCKYGDVVKNAKGESMIECVLLYEAWLKEPEWFCADGERR